MLRWTWVFAVVLTGCFNTTYVFENGDLLCDTGGACPPGFVCHGERCYRIGIVPDSGSPADVPLSSDAAEGCSSGARRCMGNQPQTCTAGAWQDLATCPVDKPTCLAGDCVAGCKPGTHECEGRTLMDCDLQGLWQPSK